MPISNVFNEECLNGIRPYDDFFFDLAIIDPPYGINVSNNMGRRKGDKKSDYKKIKWDNESPSLEFFNELLRVSKRSIIWGANHFISKIPYDSSCWLLWDKGFSEELTFSQFEMAWTNLDGMCKKYDKNPNLTERIHPTQKPVQLYKWIIMNFASEGYNILDTHMGSQSSRIASYQLGFDYWGWEIDKDYFEKGNKRFYEEIMQQSLF